MAKKENLKIVADDFVDVTRFAYDEGVNVEMTGQMFYALMRIVGNLANEEVKWMYQINPLSLAETAKQDNMVNVISNEGVTYFNILGEMEMLHTKNIKDGKTVDVEELQAKMQEKINSIIQKGSEEVGNVEVDTKTNPKQATVVKLKKSKRGE